MNVILFDDPFIRVELLPFTFMRPVGKIRTGILTIEEKWNRWLGTTSSFLTEHYLQKKYPLIKDDHNLLINGAVCPDENLVKVIRKLEPGSMLIFNNLVIASNQQTADVPAIGTIKVIHYENPITVIDRPWKIFRENGAQIRADFNIITQGKTSCQLQDKHTIIYGAENLFIEEGVDVKASVINAENGPVYLGKGSTVQEGSLIRGPFALCEGAHLNMGAKMRGDVTIGPYSKAGGEVSASVIFGYSNKAHDGFLGCSVIGEWCNLGADTNTSNLKNNYASVKLWSHSRKAHVDTGLQFCGLMMGDHSKCSINTMFNTGTVVDVAANIFGEGFPHNYVPSFSWGGARGFTTFKLDKALEVAERVMARRNIPLDGLDVEIMTYLFDQTASARTWETNNKLYET